MSKKKRSKILATLLCATTMAAFYVSPRLVFAVNLNQTPDGTVTTDSGNNNQPINNIEGLESITFGVQGDLGTGGVRFYFDGTGTYGGLVADGSLTATDLYITVANNADGDGYSSNRYSLRNALGIHRTGTGDEAVTNIEANAQGHGGMQVSSDTVSILDGAAIFSNETTSSTGGQIAFDSAFDSAQGMTVGTNFVLDSTGKISRVNGIDVQGALTTTGTINSMTIGSNQVNGVTMLNSNVTANTITGTDITDGTYHLSQIGSILSDVEEIDDKTEGIAGYDAMTGTTFTGNVRASGGLVTGTGTISDTNSHSFTVEQAQNVITSVNDSTSGLAATNTLANRNRTDIDGLTERVGTAEGHITTLTGNVTDLTGKVTTAEGEIDTLQTATTGMSYNDGSGTTFAQNVTANDFKIAGGTSLSQVASELTTAQGNIQTNTNNITTLTGRVTTAESEIGTLQSTTADHGSRITANTSNITALTGRVTTAEGEIDTLQTATTGMNYNSGTGTTFNQVVNATDFKAGDITLTGVAGDLDTAEGRISANETAINGLGTRVATAETDITGLKNKTHGFDPTGETLELTTINSTTGTVGGVTFNGGTATGLNTIGTVADTVTVAGTAISNGSFNGVNIGVDSDSHATFNGVSIYQDTNNDNDVMVGGINISELQSTTGTKLEGIVREPNEQGGGYTTTIEGSLAVNSATGNVTVDGEVTADDFRVGDTTFTNVASNVTNLNTVTTGMTYTPAGNDTQAVTSFNHEVQATNITTTAGADLNELSATVGDESSGLVQNVNTLNNKTTNLSPDGSSLTNMTNIESAAGTIGGISFATVNGMKTIGSADDTITVAGAEITSNSFNNVEIYQNDENSHYFVGDVDVSALQSGSAEITNKLRGITYSSDDPDDPNNYTMTFAEHFSVSTSGEFTFKDGTGNEYHLDDLINTVDTGDLEDKRTGISFDKESGSTTISDMTGTDTDGDGINDSFTKGDNSLTVGDDGITANGDTVINGDTDDNTTGGNGNDSNDPQGGDSIINGDQLVDGDQHVTGDSQFDGTVTVGTGTDGNGQTVINGGTINTGNTVIDGGQVKADEGHFGNITVGEGDNKTTIGESGIQVGDNTTIDNSGVSIKDENGNVFMGDHDVVIKDSDGNVEASLSDVANRVDGIEQSIGDLNSRMGELEDRIDKVGAMAAAIANLRTMGYDPAAPTEVAVGIGQYRNETGAALGLFHYPNRDFMLSLSVSTSGDEVMGGIGATWRFGRKSPEKLAAEKAEKAREAKLQKAEAIKEAARLKKIEAQQERHAKLAAQKTATK